MSNLNITQDFIPSGRKNRPGRANPMYYVTIHETGNTSKGAGSKNHANYLKGLTATNMPISWHYTVDDKETYQHLPENETALHAGDGANGTGNLQSIGIEICVNSDGDYAKTIDRTANLVVDICKRRGIPITNVVQHNHWNGKNCPQNLRAGKPFGWAEFVRRVELALDSTLEPSPTPPTTEFKVNDEVQFTGGGVYISSTASTPVHSRGASRCKLSQIANGRKQPYHLISMDKGGVYGWAAAVDVQSVTTTNPVPTEKSLDEIAREVIRGLWGNGQERVNRLTAAGYDYAVVQRRVNELVR